MIWVWLPLAAMAAAAVAALTAGIVALLRMKANARDWRDAELRDMADPPDPLTREVSPVELADAHIFDELVAAHPVHLGWAPPTWSQEWMVAGERLRELGDTQSMPVVRTADDLASAAPRRTGAPSELGGFL